jgi:hypothetical protein
MRADRCAIRGVPRRERKSRNGMGVQWPAMHGCGPRHTMRQVRLGYIQAYGHPPHYGGCPLSPGIVGRAATDKARYAMIRPFVVFVAGLSMLYQEAKRA